jgi:hypothetical protein
VARYRRLRILAGNPDPHQDGAVNGPLVARSLDALKPFKRVSEMQVRTLLALLIWRKDLTEEEFQHILRKALKR